MGSSKWRSTFLDFEELGREGGVMFSWIKIFPGKRGEGHRRFLWESIQGVSFLVEISLSQTRDHTLPHRKSLPDQINIALMAWVVISVTTYFWNFSLSSNSRNNFLLKTSGWRGLLGRPPTLWDVQQTATCAGQDDCWSQLIIIIWMWYQLREAPQFCCNF